MSPEDEAEIAAAMRAARERARGYADFFGWAPNRDLEEQGVVTSLAETLELEGRLFFSQIRRRGRGNDPPDLEALDGEGRRLAIEVTEVVDGRAIESWKAGRLYDWAEWTREKFLGRLGALLGAKNARYPKLKDGPYRGGYLVVAFTDEPALSRAAVQTFLQGYAFNGLPNISRAVLLLSYDPHIQRCPCFELVLNR